MMANTINIPSDLFVAIVSTVALSLLAFSGWLTKTLWYSVRTSDRTEEAVRGLTASVGRMESQVNETRKQIDHVHDCVEARTDQLQRHLATQDVRLAVLEHSTGVNTVVVPTVVSPPVSE